MRENAGTLIITEIDRIDRIALSASAENGSQSMRKCAQQYRELPQSKRAQNSEDCRNENLSLALSRIVD
ncbi:hypothetical protein J8I87_23520 [Paraburkholderia sp. LEh10]|uniref:hypothetical protein n=1 Tax=Paraburkholderia sp. LEh10 TaxID=2821353 RepID=UPI001AE2EEA1|nr:hypothetical protein [Paraburkholderia sp. LEh10]MBP0592651.1 hypothetical protein [Paraburkholderia sp. LEh10]